MGRTFCALLLILLQVNVSETLYGVDGGKEPFTQTENLLGSRPPFPGCTWKRHEFKELGIRILFQDCKDPSAHYELSVKGDWLEMHRPSDDVTYGGRYLLQVFSKPANQDIKETIKKNFVDTIELEDEKIYTSEARKSCRVVPFTEFKLGKGKVALTIDSTGKYRKKISRDLENEPRDFGCGEYGRGQTTTYFEYHPHESKTKYIFVIYGQDEDALFDQNSIQFFTGIYLEKSSSHK